MSGEAMSDPTTQSPTGPAADATGHWAVSLAEIDAMGKKAARGAGFAWGLAEEAGRAARWLAAYGQPGPEALLMALEAIDGAAPAHAPRIDGAKWRGARGPLCPVETGAALSDRADLLAEGGAVRLGPVLAPILLVPFLCRAARDLGIPLDLDGPVTLVATPDGPVSTDWARLNEPRLEGLRVGRSDEPGGPVVPAGPGPWRVSVETWRGLERLAHRTYVPATEASRAGAGAGVRDTD